MKLVVHKPNASPLSDEEINRENCECSCDENHCEDCGDCQRRERRGINGPCDSCGLGECDCSSNCEHDYCTCENEEGLYSHDKDVLNVFNAYVDNDEEKDQVLLGAELELEISGSTSNAHTGFEAAFTAAPYFIGKADGSLDDGMEMVTLPLTLEEHEKTVKALAEHWFPTMGKSSTCGMHVHVSKEAFKDDQHMTRFANFFSGHDANKDWNLFLDRLFRRSENNYCKRLDSGSALRQNGKYSAVNFSKQYTLEIRGFHTTKSVAVYMANLELILAVKDVTVNSQMGSNSSPRAFINYVNSNEVLYPHLAKRLTISHKDDGSELFAPWLGEIREGELSLLTSEELTCA